MFGRSPVGRVGLMFTADGKLQLGHRFSPRGPVRALPAVVPAVEPAGSHQRGVWDYAAEHDAPGFTDALGYGCADWVGEDCHYQRRRGGCRGRRCGYSASGLAAVRAACPGACNPRPTLALIFVHVAKSGGASVGSGIQALGVPHFQIHTLNRGRAGAQLACIGCEWASARGGGVSPFFPSSPIDPSPRPSPQPPATPCVARVEQCGRVPPFRPRTAGWCGPD